MRRISLRTALAGAGLILALTATTTSAHAADKGLAHPTTKGAQGAGFVQAPVPGTVLRVETRSNAKFCPGTVCPQTKRCFATKGALGAGCKTR